MKYTLEICAGSLQSALAGSEGGADRIELCDNLYEGGTTPSYGMIKTCRTLLNIPVFPIIRPRGGDFVYSPEEFEVMKQDVVCCAELGCEGVVFGILKVDGTIDMEKCGQLMELAGAMQVTFHRAFDHCNDHEKGLEDIIKLRCNRVLTSGGEIYAEEAISKLRSLVVQAQNRISIMPGSGITENNLLSILKGTGAVEFHSTAKTRAEMDSNNPVRNTLESYPYKTDIYKVIRMRDILRFG